MRRDSHQRGSALLEALIAFLVLSFGMMAMARMQTHIRLAADIARQRSEAVRLAQEQLESDRAFTTMETNSGAAPYAGLQQRSFTVDASTGYRTDTSYVITQSVSDHDAPGAKTVSVIVDWKDLGGGAQKLALHSIIAGIDPRLSGALGLAHGGEFPRGQNVRSAWIPPGAKNLGDGSSAFKPAINGAIAFVFDNATGQLIGRCTGVAANLATSDLVRADLIACDSRAAYLLGGIVRFSSDVPPDPARATDAPLSTEVSLSLTGGNYAVTSSCVVDAADANAGDRHLAYYCAVYPLPNGKWSGATSLRPIGWSIGTAPGDRRVCRYTSDLDGSGAIDANIEHPAIYVDVDNALVNQNFLVIMGSQTCPTSLGTAQIQP